jgi:hypothetical protein
MEKQSQRNAPLILSVASATESKKNLKIFSLQMK